MQITLTTLLFTLLAAEPLAKRHNSRYPTKYSSSGNSWDMQGSQYGQYGQSNGQYGQSNGQYGQSNGQHGQSNGQYGQSNGQYGQSNGQSNGQYGQNGQYGSNGMGSWNGNQWNGNQGSNDDIYQGFPKEIRAPSGSKLISKTFGVGTQNYKCSAGKWALESVNANQYKELRDLEHVDISYFFLNQPDSNGGQPSWMYLDDFSVFTGKPIVKVTVDQNSIPWVVLSRTSGSNQGLLSKATTLLRVHTKGGNPPNTPCNEGQFIRVRYSAEYWFFSGPSTSRPYYGY
ncbi:hypothetical protein HDV06_001094 [Boothiomyces sp. JEL0866]|nr:hypothetical protein HDV06_001094 [Boothiomyces sp. JEL0866]